ncbi:hypothetical protein FKW77_000752 [Venturia effusa]|uniref:Uncharacterized protein n=1 Tax=Venturia effusa TaxID=50376 RepID=A0A517L6J9_9PEZI|nr:hypothetical protein FKW77_000752 [Venturia effusa]
MPLDWDWGSARFGPAKTRALVYADPLSVQRVSPSVHCKVQPTERLQFADTCARLKIVLLRRSSSKQAAHLRLLGNRTEPPESDSRKRKIYAHVLTPRSPRQRKKSAC